jgi:hypothetical protein
MALCGIALSAVPKTVRDDARNPGATMPVEWATANKTTGNEAGMTAEAPPSEVRIGNVEFEVQMQPFPDTYVGMTHFETHTVQIDPASQGEMRKQVFLHEMLHVAWHNGNPSPDKDHKFTEEEAIRALTPGLLKMLAENPDAVGYLQK